MKQLHVRLWLSLLLAAFLVCDSASGHNPTATIHADQEQVSFFDRPASLAAARKSGTPSPVLILLEPNPWNAVIGSDTPTFALYEDGTAIYQTNADYKSVRLSDAERQDLLRSLNVEDLSRRTGYYRTTEGTDQPEADILVYGGSKPFYISVYGSLASPDVRSKLPREIVTAYDRLHSFTHPKAKDWLPDTIEMMIWPYEYAPDPSIVWPKDWPGLDDPTTRKRGDGSFSIFVPSSQLQRLRSFFRTRRPKGAVEIGGKKWAADIRFPFPHERLWMGPKTP
jgi:hypothetical protein